MDREERRTAPAGGKRVAPKAAPAPAPAPRSGGGWVTLIVVFALALAALAGYLVLCSKAGDETLWPGTSMMGIDLGGLTYEESAEKLKQELPAKLAEKDVELYEPVSGARESLAADGLLETETLVDDLWRNRDLGNFFTRGARYLTSMISKSGGMDIPAVLEMTEEGEQRLDEALQRVAEAAGVTGNESSWEATSTELILTKGTTARAIDVEKARTDVKTALLEGSGGTVEVSITEAPPRDLDLDAIHQEVYTEPVNASLNVKTMDVTSDSVGVDFDVNAARTAFSSTGEGQECRIPLTITEPSVTASALKALLFRDTLGSAVTKFSGSSDRLKSIKNAAGFINGKILLPGEEFSYNRTCEPYTESNGYGKAGAYVGGATVDTVAGGICQLSSTLYWSTLKGNLKISERHNHAYYPSYISGGLDATVYGGGADFRFVNNTEYPIKLETYVDSKKYVHAIIYGTNLTGVHGEPYATNKVITKRASVEYVADASVPIGTTKKDSTRTPYDGATIEAYQKLVDASGNTISETLIHKDTYRSRNQRILYNPADEWRLSSLTSSGSFSSSSTATPTPETPSPQPEQPSGEQVPAIPNPIPTLPPVVPEVPTTTVPLDPGIGWEQYPVPGIPSQAPVVPEVPVQTPIPEVPVQTPVPEAPVQTPAPEAPIIPTPMPAPDTPVQIPLDPTTDTIPVQQAVDDPMLPPQ